METIETNHIIDFSDRLFKLMVGLITLAAVFFIGEILYQFGSLPKNAPHEISVSGEGKTYAKPDVAMIELGVTSQAAKSQDAVNENNQKMNAVINAIKNLGVQDKDIQTTSYSLSPTYGPSQPTALYPYPGTGRIAGYMLSQQVQVKIRDFNKINDVLDKATSSGANTVGSLQFTVDDMEKVKADARAKAIENAKGKVSTLTQQAGLHIEKLVNISENYGSAPVPFYGQGLGAVSADKSVAPQIQAGQMEVDSTVTLTYRVN